MDYLPTDTRGENMNRDVAGSENRDSEPVEIPPEGVRFANGGNRHCRVCGVFDYPMKSVCGTCGVNNNSLDTMLKEPPGTFASTIVWVGGAGYGVGGAYSDTFHILTLDRTESVCGRISTCTSGSVETGLSWATPVFTLSATSEWQSSLCGHCKQHALFDVLDTPVGECLEKETVPVGKPGLWDGLD